MEENMNKLMETNRSENALKHLIELEWRKHAMIVDESGRTRHYNYILGLETAYDLISNNYHQVGLKA